MAPIGTWCSQTHPVSSKDIFDSFLYTFVFFSIQFKCSIEEDLDLCDDLLRGQIIAEQMSFLTSSYLCIRQKLPVLV